jgi:hypothetical protein
MSANADFIRYSLWERARKGLLGKLSLGFNPCSEGCDSATSRELIMTIRTTVTITAVTLLSGLLVTSSALAGGYRLGFVSRPAAYAQPVFAPMARSTPMTLPQSASVFAPGQIVTRYFQGYSPINTVVTYGTYRAFSTAAAMDGAMGVSRFLSPNIYTTVGQILFVPGIVH